MSQSFTKLSGKAALRVHGPDAQTFLQGLLSNDMKKATPTRAIHAGFLTGQGKLLFDLLIAQGEEGYWLILDAAQEEALRQKLAQYRLRAKVEFESPSDRAVYAIWGDAAAETFGLPNAFGAARTETGLTLFIDPRLGALGLIAIADEAAWQALSAKHALVAREETFFRRHRIALGVPERFPSESPFLLECNFEELNGVDFKKGCYVGQELTARMKHRGTARRRILEVTAEGGAALPAPGAPIMAGRLEIGALLEVEGERGLAQIRIDRLPEDDAPIEIEGQRVTLTPPPYLPALAKDA